ncbi:MAG: hypothetical protein JNM57_13440 [Cyclobacteriaceae bacterium]|nr:hypothetical protein [Cyclobacteriaceae bacterium]
MKKLSLVLIMLCVMTPKASSISFAQSSSRNNRVTSASGIYLTLKNLQEDSISFFSSTPSSTSLRVTIDHDIILEQNGNPITFAFGTIAGYINNGERYRAYGNKKKPGGFGYYKILMEEDLIFYSKKAMAPKSGNPMFYYYSDTLYGPLHRIKQGELKKYAEHYPAFAACLDNKN